MPRVRVPRQRRVDRAMSIARKVSPPIALAIAVAVVLFAFAAPTVQALLIVWAFCDWRG